MDAAIKLQPVDRVPNAPFYEGPICRYFGPSLRAALLEDQVMAEAHLAALEEFKFDWVMVGMGLIGGIIPEALGAPVSYPDDVFPVIEKNIVKSAADMECPLLISPDHYRQFVHGPTGRVVNALAALGARVLPHMCGEIVKTGIVDLLLEMDIHGIMPGNLTQETVLDLQALKDKCGERICIFDNLNPNGSLLIGSPEEVAAETRAHLKKAQSMTGYIFSTSGTTSPSIPRANFEAMNKAVLEFSS
jgi:uroporphyrinogen-III decarboxylase